MTASTVKRPLEVGDFRRRPSWGNPAPIHHFLASRTHPRKPAPRAGFGDDFREAGLARIERESLTKVTGTAGGNITEVCRTSGLSRSRFCALLKKHGIALPQQDPGVRFP